MVKLEIASRTWHPKKRSDFFVDIIIIYIIHAFNSAEKSFEEIQNKEFKLKIEVGLYCWILYFYTKSTQ